MVRLLNAVGAVVAQDTSGLDGRVTLSDIPEGLYLLQVGGLLTRNRLLVSPAGGLPQPNELSVASQVPGTCPVHSCACLPPVRPDDQVSARGHVTVERQQRVLGASGPVQIFLQLQVVQISFTVVPTTYTEETEVVVDLVFQTNVPAPVVSRGCLVVRPTAVHLPGTELPAQTPAHCPNQPHLLQLVATPSYLKVPEVLDNGGTHIFITNHGAVDAVGCNTWH